jgi:hypothetical protein
MGCGLWRRNRLKKYVCLDLHFRTLGLYIFIRVYSRAYAGYAGSLSKGKNQEHDINLSRLLFIIAKSLNALNIYM